MICCFGYLSFRWKQDSIFLCENNHIAFFMINNVITLCKWESYSFGGGYLIRYHVMVSVHTLWTWWWSLPFTFDECFIWKWNFIFVLLMGTDFCLFLFPQTENGGKKVMRKVDVDAVDGWMSCYCRVTVKILQNIYFLN